MTRFRLAARSRRAFTLIELLVVIAIIGVLIGMAAPAVQAVRESARRATCQANLSQLVLALDSYEAAQGALPAGVVAPRGPIENLPNGLHQGWSISLLPYLDERAAFKAFDEQASVHDAKNQPVVAVRPEMFVCPSTETNNRAASDYAGCHHDAEAPIDVDNHGVLFLNSHVTWDDITDGKAHTLFLAEKRTEADDANWLCGTRATLRNTADFGCLAVSAAGQNAALPDSPDSSELAAKAGASRAKAARPSDAPGGVARPAPRGPLFVGPFGSYHAGAIVMAAFGDGSVHAVSDTIDADLFRSFGNRADGGLTPPSSQW